MSIEPVSAAGGVLEHTPANLADRIRYAETLAAANLLPKAYRDNPPNVLLAMDYGDALGLSPMVAIQSIHVIEGKPSQSADLMATLVRRAGHRLRVTIDPAGHTAKAVLIRRDDPDFPFESVWTIDDAKNAGLVGKDNWKKYPGAMLKARAISEVCRMGASECLLGIEYTPDEVEGFRSSSVTVTQTRNWRAEADALAGDVEALKKLHGEAHVAGALKDDPGLSEYMRSRKAPAAVAPAPAAAPVERIDVGTGEVLDGEVVEDAPPPVKRRGLTNKTGHALLGQFERFGVGHREIGGWLPKLGFGDAAQLTDLSEDEGAALLGRLAEIADRDGFVAVVDGGAR